MDGFFAKSEAIKLEEYKTKKSEIKEIILRGDFFKFPKFKN